MAFVCAIAARGVWGKKKLPIIVFHVGGRWLCCGLGDASTLGVSDDPTN